MTTREKQVAYIVGGIVVAAVIISASSNGDRPPDCHLVPVLDGQHIEVCE